MANRSFEVVSSPSKTKKIIIPVVAAVVVLVGVLIFVFSGSKEEPLPPLAPVKIPAQAPGTVPEQPSGVKVVAKDPAKQAEVDQQLQQLMYYVNNPTMDDANITIQWLTQKFNQPPEVVVRDLKVLIERLQGLNDADLAAFFNSDQNPWREDPGYNSIIKFISHRDYLEFVKKCIALYQTQAQG